MPTLTENREPVSTPKRNFRFRWLIAIAVGLVLCVAAGFVVVSRQWPFNQAAIIQALQQQSGRTVRISSFREFYFPHPGCVAEGLTFRHNPDGTGPPLIAIQKLVVVGRYAGLLTDHIAKIHVVGLHITIPRRERVESQGGPLGKVGTLSTGLVIGQIVADGSEIDIERDNGDKPLVFQIPKLTLNDLYDNRPLSFSATVQIPQPPAKVDVAGKFGPWVPGNAGQTALSGSYDLRDMDLGVFGGIGGLLASKGNFAGVLQHVQVQGTTEIPKFVVSRSGHPLALKTEFHALVNGLNGDVAFDPVTAHFARTTIVSTGTVAGTSEAEGVGKTLTMESYSADARVQDLVRLFIREPVSPMLGTIVFRAKVTVPPDDRPFLDRVHMLGDFGIAGGKYTNRETQKDVDVLSARAKGKADEVEDIDDKLGNDSYDPGRVLSNVQGHVELKNSVAHLSHVSFDVPGASALVDGDYKLKTEQLNFKGQMRLDTKLSKATTGVKSFLLKIVEPLTSNKKQKGSMVSLTVGGTYHNPTYTVLPATNKQ